VRAGDLWAWPVRARACGEPMKNGRTGRHRTPTERYREIEISGREISSSHEARHEPSGRRSSLIGSSEHTMTTRCGRGGSAGCEAMGPACSAAG